MQPLIFLLCIALTDLHFIIIFFKKIVEIPLRIRYNNKNVIVPALHER